MSCIIEMSYTNMKSQNTDELFREQCSNWFCLKHKPRWLRMRNSCAFSTKCGNRPSCQAYVSQSPPGSRVLRLLSQIPPFPLCLIEMMSALLWIPWQHEPQGSYVPGHGCVSRHSAQSSSGQSFSGAVTGGAVCKNWMETLAFCGFSNTT